MKIIALFLENLSKDESTSHLETIIGHNSNSSAGHSLSASNSFSSNQQSLTQTTSSKPITKSSLKQHHQQQQQQPTPVHQQFTTTIIHPPQQNNYHQVPLLTANTHRCNSNISNCSSVSSGQGSSISSTSSKLTTTTSKSVLPIDLSDSALLNSNGNSSLSASPNPTTNGIINNNITIASNAGDLQSQADDSASLPVVSDMQLSVDLANLLYSFNSIIESSLFHGNLMRSASSAGETITKNSHEVLYRLKKH